ncbi:MAG: hypothetical protein KJ574_05110, partial [Nanoarchaeota archaeon]|nr:hypothetical protein [Nanoarchaeota archaeon]
MLDNNILVGKELLNKINAIEDFAEFYNPFKTGYVTGEVKIDNTSILDILTRSQQNTSAATAKTPKAADNLPSSVNVIFSYEGIPKKRELQDFVSLFNYRYNALKGFLMKRKELESPTAINRALSKTDREEVAIIGMISDKRISKNGHVILNLEDPTGIMRVLINKNRPEMFEMAKDCVLDEVIGVTGSPKENLLFANNLLLPDIPLTKELKKAPEEVYAAFISDMHFGSKMFMHEEWNKFLKWIGGETGSDEQKELASKIRYLFIVGDLVEGVGIYPGQENDLEVRDIYEQYNIFAQF